MVSQALVGFLVVGLSASFFLVRGVAGLVRGRLAVADSTFAAETVVYGWPIARYLARRARGAEAMTLEGPCARLLALEHLCLGAFALLLGGLMAVAP